MKNILSLAIVLPIALVSGLHAARPNFVLIMADDLGYGDLGCYGQQHIQTPYIDRLAAQGMRFTQAYAGSCVCTPSRAVLMTGRHNGHAPARDNIPHYESYLQEDDVTVAEILGQAGYQCGGVGKWSLGDAGSIGRATGQGFDTWFGYLNQDHAHYYYSEYLDDNDGQLQLPDNSQSHQHYSHRLIAERALKFIRDSHEQPFFLYAAFTLPHFSASSEDQTSLPVPSDAPYSQMNWTQAEKNYAAMVTMLDADVGRIARLIDELGVGSNTLLIVTSDNGPWGDAPQKFNSNGLLRGEKRDLYEGGIRIPFVARWPGTIPPGTTNSELLAFWDIMPTFAELAGASPPANIDGISMACALRGEKLDRHHEYLYWDYGHCRERYDQAVRLGRWKGIRLGQQAPIQLYDLSQDPGEHRDLAAQQPDVVARIDQIMSTAATPNRRYPIGQRYSGKPLWRPDGRSGQGRR